MLYLFKLYPIPTITSAPKYIPNGFKMITALDSNKNNIKFVDYLNDSDQLISYSEEYNKIIDCKKLKDTSFAKVLEPIIVPNSDQSCYIKLSAESGTKYSFMWTKNTTKYTILTDNNLKLDDYTLLNIAESKSKKIIFFNSTKLFTNSSKQ